MKTTDRSFHEVIFGTRLTSLRLIILSSAFSSLIFQRGIFLLYLIETGLSNAQISIVQTALFLSNFLFEVPSGLFADNYGRKNSILAYTALAIVNAIGMIFAQNFAAFFLLFCVNGIALAFQTGATSALVYDQLKTAKKSGEFVVVNSRIRIFSAISLSIALACGGMLQSVGWGYVYGSYAVAVLISAMLIFIRATYENSNLEVSCNEEEIIFNAYSTYKRKIGLDGQTMTAYSAVSVLMSIMGLLNSTVHATGVNGLEGGYPMKTGLSSIHVESNSELEKMIECNRAGQRFDAIDFIDEEGKVHFTQEGIDLLNNATGVDLRYCCLNDLNEISFELNKALEVL